MIATARRRAQTARLDNIIFRESALDSFEDNNAFDCVVGRDVLIHQSDPVRAPARGRALRKGRRDIGPS
jgi:hypothetical protein